MKEIDLAAVVGRTVHRFNDRKTASDEHAHVSILPNLTKFMWRDSSLEHLMRRFLRYVLCSAKLARPVHVSVYEKMKMEDLEKFLSISRLCWIFLRVFVQGSAGFGIRAKQILRNLGYRCEKWVGVEGSDIQLGTYSLANARDVKLILCVQNRKMSEKCEILVPVTRLSAAPA